MRYEERPAPAGLHGIASRVWYLEAPRLRTFEKILPLPFVHVIVNLSEPYRLFDRHGAATEVSDAFVSGLQSEYLVIESPPLIRHVGIALTPAGLHTLAPDAAAASAESVQDARAVLTGVRAARVGEADRLVTAVLDAIHSDPDAPIGAIAETLGVSHRTLIARFRAVTGITPKRHARVWRFHRFVDTVQVTGGSPDWAGLAAASGYYDQPHVIRAFRRFSGWTPAEYHRLVAVHGPETAHFVPLEQVPGAADQARS